MLNKMSTPVEKLSMLPIAVHLVVSRNETLLVHTKKARKKEGEKDKKLFKALKIQLSFVRSLSQSLTSNVRAFYI